MPRRKLPPPPGEPPRESRHAGQQPKEVTDKVKELLDEGFEPGPISKRLNIGRSAVYRMTTNIALYGTPYAPKNDKPNGRPKLLTYEQEVEVAEWVKANPSAYLDDMVWFIHSKFSVVVSVTTALKLRRKWIEKMGMEDPKLAVREAKAKKRKRDS